MTDGNQEREVDRPGENASVNGIGADLDSGTGANGVARGPEGIDLAPDAERVAVMRAVANALAPRDQEQIVRDQPTAIAHADVNAAVPAPGVPSFAMSATHPADEIAHERPPLALFQIAMSPDRGGRGQDLARGTGRRRRSTTGIRGRSGRRRRRRTWLSRRTTGRTGGMTGESRGCAKTEIVTTDAAMTGAGTKRSMTIGTATTGNEMTGVETTAVAMTGYGTIATDLQALMLFPRRTDTSRAHGANDAGVAAEAAIAIVIVTGTGGTARRIGTDATGTATETMTEIATETGTGTPGGRAIGIDLGIACPIETVTGTVVDGTEASRRAGTDGRGVAVAVAAAAEDAARRRDVCTTMFE